MPGACHVLVAFLVMFAATVGAPFFNIPPTPASPAQLVPLEGDVPLLPPMLGQCSNGSCGRCERLLCSLTVHVFCRFCP